MKQSTILLLLLLCITLQGMPVVFDATLSLDDIPLAGSSNDPDVIYHHRFSIPAILNEVITTEGNLLQVNTLDTCIQPGAPLLPQYNIQLTLEGNYHIENVALSNGTIFQGSTQDAIIPAHDAVVWNTSPQNFSRTPSPAIYQQDALYPGSWLNYTAGFDGENTMISVHLYPAQWNPVSHKVYYLTQGTLAVSGSPAQPAHHQTNGLRTAAQNIYICPPDWTPVVDSMAAYHTAQGITTDVVTTSWISANYTAAEDPSNNGYANQNNPDIQNYDYTLAKQIVAYLRDDQAHPNLESITICGTGAEVPPSYYFMYYSGYDGWIPSDQFYASPDYDWVDDFSVNRISLYSIQELSAYFHKCTTWSNTLSGYWTQTATVSGGMPFDTPYFIGEMIDNQVVCDDLLDEMTIEKYQRHNDLFSSIPMTNHMKNDDYLLHLHICHGSGNAIYFDNDTSISASDMMNFPQKERLPLMLSVACDNAAFDTQLYNAGFSRSFAEGMLASAGAGIGYIGGSRSNGGLPEYYLTNGNLVYTGHTDTYSLLYFFLEGYRTLPSPTMSQLTAYAKDRFRETRPLTSNNQAAYVRFAALVDGALILPDAPDQNPTSTPPAITLDNATGTNADDWQTLTLSFTENPSYTILDSGNYQLEWIDIHPNENVTIFGPVSTNFTLEIESFQHKILNKVITVEAKEAWHYSVVNKEAYQLRILDGNLSDWEPTDVIATDPAGDIQQSSFDLTTLMFATDQYTDNYYFALPLNFDETNFGTTPVVIYYVMAFDTAPGGFVNNYSQGDYFPVPNVWCGFDDATIDKLIYGQIIYFNQIANLDVEMKIFDPDTQLWQSGLIPGATINETAMELAVAKSYFTGDYCKMALFTSVNGGIILDAIPTDPQCPNTVTYGEENAFSLSSYIDLLPYFTDASGQVTPVVKATLRNYPNPFNPSTEIIFSLSNERGEHSEHIAIDIYNIKGQKIKQLQITNVARLHRQLPDTTRQELREEHVTWDGTDTHGHAVASGLYFAQLKSGNKPLAQRKMLLLK